MYADDLVLVAQSKEELREKVLRWKECMELKGLKVNIEKTFNAVIAVDGFTRGVVVPDVLW